MRRTPDNPHFVSINTALVAILAVGLAGCISKVEPTPGPGTPTLPPTATGVPTPGVTPESAPTLPFPWVPVPTHPSVPITPETTAIAGFPPGTVFGGEVDGRTGDGPLAAIEEDMHRRGWQLSIIQIGQIWCYVVRETNGTTHMYPNQPAFIQDYINLHRVAINGDQAWGRPEGLDKSGACLPPSFP